MFMESFENTSKQQLRLQEREAAMQRMQNAANLVVENSNSSKKLKQHSNAMYEDLFEGSSSNNNTNNNNKQKKIDNNSNNNVALTTNTNNNHKGEDSAKHHSQHPPV